MQRQQQQIVLVDDAHLLSIGIALLLLGRLGIEPVLLDATDPEVFSKVRSARPHVVVVSTIDAGAGLALAGRVLRENAETTVIAVGLDGPDMIVYRSGDVRPASPSELLSAIEEAVHGEVRSPR